MKSFIWFACAVEFLTATDYIQSSICSISLSLTASVFINIGCNTFYKGFFGGTFCILCVCAWLEVMATSGGPYWGIEDVQRTHLSPDIP